MTKTDKIITIGFAIMSVLFLIVTICNWAGFAFSDTMISVKEGGYFETSEAVIRELNSGYIFKTLFWFTLSVFHTLRLIFFWKEN